MKKDHEHVIGVDLDNRILILEGHREFIDEKTCAVFFRYCPLCGEKIQKE